MTVTEHIITIGLCVLAVQITRLVPFWLFPRQPPDSRIYPLPWQSATRCNVWNVGDLLLQKYRYFRRTPWLARLYRRSISVGIAFLEKEYVYFHFSRHAVLYGVSAAGVCCIT